MNKEDAVAIMMESINTDNKQFCLDNGMSEEKSNESIAQSQMSLGFMMSNIYDKLVEAQVIVV
jgi:hypothetical protein